MGTSDLLAELNSESFKVDPDTERRVCHVVLQQLDDQSGDISGLAVKWWVDRLSPGTLTLLCAEFPVRDATAGRPVWGHLGPGCQVVGCQRVPKIQPRHSLPCP